MLKLIFEPIIVLIVLLLLSLILIGIVFLVNGKDWDKTVGMFGKIGKSKFLNNLKNKVLKFGDWLLAFLKLEDNTKK